MPHITNFRDKKAKMMYDKIKLSDIINEILDKYCNNEDFFDRFVDVKEVQHGKYN